MPFIEPRIDEAWAISFFERRRPGNLWGLIRPRHGSTGRVGAGGPRRLPCVELIWLPHHLINMRVTSRRGPGEISVVVEGHSGAFAVFERHENLVDGLPAENAFPPKLDTEEALGIARRQLLRSIMRRRGQRYKPVIEGAVHAGVFHYPFWIYYYERRRGRIDIRILDALTGEKGGARTKAGVLSALIGDDAAARAAFEKHSDPRANRT